MRLNQLVSTDRTKLRVLHQLGMKKPVWIFMQLGMDRVPGYAFSPTLWLLRMESMRIKQQN